MPRPPIVASVLALAAFFVLAGSAAAATPPSPPPLAANSQPVTLTSDGQGQPAVAHCGASAAAGGNSYSASPTEISSAGASSSPNACGDGAPATSSNPAGQSAATGGSGRPGTSSAVARQSSAGESVSPTQLLGGSAHGTSGLAGGALWPFLLLLLVAFLVLIGFAIGRRRPARATA